MQKFIEEFKEFAVRGNVMDLAVGVIIGGAFGKIVSSLVQDVLMPIIGIITGGVNLAKLNWALIVPGRPSVVINYGSFLQNVFDFIIIAICIFAIIKFFNSMKRKEDVKEEKGKVDVATELSVLSEIRDLLKKNKVTK